MSERSTSTDRSGCCTSRRDVLRTVGVGALAAPLLSACGDGSGPTPTPADDGSVRVPVADVPVGESRYYSDGGFVVSRPAPDEVAAFDATCPHNGCAVSEREGVDLLCPCHASTFDAATGAVLSGPATTGLTARTARLEDDQIVISG
ncbi:MULTISPECIES: Rieske (2Fe-2S) protein [unclassified Ornithinimicrobium]|uniref:Rieske (2Fe-2S) protein n=1 Tax=unclassified Ornithinimicrobium TaxID=2615080 RepID=UPI003851BFB3